MKVSGYIPVYNNEFTVLAALDSMRNQKLPLDEVFAVDDGSTDNSVTLLEQRGVKVFRQPTNLGRGATRARAMREARNDLVLCCDATNILSPGFTLGALPWFEDASVAAVFGRIREGRNCTAVERWRARHLFKNHVHMETHRSAILITYGTIVRSSAVESVGGYNAVLRHTEDAELGQRLLDRGFDVIFDPHLEVRSIAHNTLVQVLERYWRWYVGAEGHTTFRRFLSQLSYSTSVMAREDLSSGDWASAGISLLSPHYCWWRYIIGFANRFRRR